MLPCSVSAIGVCLAGSDGLPLVCVCLAAMGHHLTQQERHMASNGSCLPNVCPGPVLIGILKWHYGPYSRHVGREGSQQTGAA